ncbi:hypothetical protein NXH67_08250 [Butyrivibrio sp. DSM 10294]|uniref:hypothetical protein n=1 Tax=Butyrivibrio sp. DSM 10294 TaxID=2972457 RepID=UPI00234ED14A|nr:hypothetical protein [Butyrivibrio sp. DSM 10294]MDC7293503.1 hypothetical protein [Butyrivibrio sp. DSM 10294]
MKKVKLLSIGLSLSLLMTGCGLNIGDRQETLPPTSGESSENTNIQLPIPNQSNEQNQASAQETNKFNGPEIKAYKKFLKERMEAKTQVCYVSLLHLDEDDVYELAVLEYEGLNYNIYLYSYDNGEVVSLETSGFPFYGGSGDFYYVDKGNRFYYEYVNGGGDTADITEFVFAMEDGKPVLKNTLTKSTLYETEETTYFIDKEKVTEEEYDTFNKQFQQEQGYSDSFTCVMVDACTPIINDDDLEDAMKIDYISAYE